MRRKLILLAGTVLLLGAAGLAGYNLWEDHRAQVHAAAVVEVLEEKLAAPSPVVEKGPPVTSFAPELPPAGPMPVEEVDGHGYIGTVEVPALGLELPVMAQWSYPNLKLAPCRYSGSAYQDNLVIAGHNYRSHFGYLNCLEVGDEVVFTDVEGNRFSYAVEELEQLPPTAVEEMTGGDWALTLFTCAGGGKARLAVRCQAPAGQ